MKTAFWARRAHKWIALVIGVQALLWMLSGLYMTVISIDVIHGDHLAHSHAEPLSTGVALVDPQVVAQRYPGLERFRIKRFLGREVYEVHSSAGVQLIDAHDGVAVGPLDESMARELALSLYDGDGAVTSMQLIDEGPQEGGTGPGAMAPGGVGGFL